MSQFSKWISNDFVHTVPGRYFRELFAAFSQRAKLNNILALYVKKKSPNFCFNDGLDPSYFVRKENLVVRRE